MSTTENIDLPERSSGDVAYAAVKAVVAAVPFVGGSAGELLGLALRPPLEKRRDEWMKSVALRLQATEQRFERLTSDPSFVTTIAAASLIAMRNHQEEKLEALRNAVVNCAIGNAPGDDLRALFLSLVDELTPTHLRILKLFAGAGSSGPHIRQEFASQREVTDQMILRLLGAGLIQDPRPYVARVRESLEPLINLGWTTSNLGSQFLKFISESR